MLSKAPQYWKAIIAFVAPGVVLLPAFMLDGSDGGSTITQNEWITALVTCVATSAGVLIKENRPKPTEPVE